MIKTASLLCFCLAGAILLDMVGYAFFGSSLAYCPAEGPCATWVVLRMAAITFLGIIGAALAGHE